MTVACDKGIIHTTLFEKHILGHWILFEKHTHLCYCSYCQENLKFIQFRIPQNKSKNSWWVLAIKIREYKYYLRVTGLITKRSKKRA